MANKHSACTLNVEKVERIFAKYPEWRRVIGLGTLSLKATRDLLGIDRYECYNAYLDMLEAGAVYGAGSNMYRASPALKEYLESHNSEV